MVATAFALARRCTKTPVRAGVCDGFVATAFWPCTNRRLTTSWKTVPHPTEIDAAVRSFGYPMGPFQVTGPGGGDIGWATQTPPPASALLPRALPWALRRGGGSHLRAQLVRPEDGTRLLSVPQGTRTGRPTRVLAIVAAGTRPQRASATDAFTPEEIMRRYMAAMVSEGAKVVEEALRCARSMWMRPSGWLRFSALAQQLCAGPTRWSLDTVLADIRAFAPGGCAVLDARTLAAPAGGRRPQLASLNRLPP